MSDWMHFSFPLEDVPSEGLSSLSVRLDLESEGEIWIDDVQVFDLAFSETERVDTGQADALANLKLRDGQLSDCARLLEGYWPQFLVANVPADANAAVLTAAQRLSLDEPPVKKPGVTRQHQQVSALNCRLR